MAAVQAADLVSQVRRAASEISGSQAGSGLKRHHRHSSSESQLSRRSSRYRDGSSYMSGSSRSRSSSNLGMSLQDQQNVVLNSAMDRFITDLQKEATVTAKANKDWEAKILADKEDDRATEHRRRQQNERNQYLLRQQIEENKMRRAEDRREYIESASTHSFPLFTETFISLDEYEAYRQAQKVTFRKELSEQLESINTMKMIQKKKDRDWAMERNNNNIGDMTKSRRDERDRLKKQGQDMVASWDRDLRLQNIKKAILSGKDMGRETQTLGGSGAMPSIPEGSSPSRLPTGSSRRF
eukprot:TRINITY_DN115649_c0_g1_i1.p1 TRINITY_DN115649_c0_g1~~TRINITY_DN115649_c0_g1_i1.p1  ORF type:complete len:297 (+),score=91.13 TRINITY_DN115649_c0_g1_i1:145-1035(+)